MQQANSGHGDAVFHQSRGFGTQRNLIERSEHMALSVQPFADLMNGLVVDLARLVLESEEILAALVPDEEQIAKAACDEEGDP